MSIVLVGGNDRMSARYKEICRKYRCKAKVFIKMPADFGNQLGQPDLVVVFTNTCSHKMLAGVRKKAEKCDFTVETIHTASVSALKLVLEKHCRG